eukprot:4391459-Pyramimonas_sp.AAC.1
MEAGLKAARYEALVWEWCPQKMEPASLRRQVPAQLGRPEHVTFGHFHRRAARCACDPTVDAMDSTGYVLPPPVIDLLLGRGCSMPPKGAHI